MCGCASDCEGPAGAKQSAEEDEESEENGEEKEEGMGNGRRYV